jgi:hypothetical protein
MERLAASHSFPLCAGIGAARGGRAALLSHSTPLPAHIPRAWRAVCVVTPRARGGPCVWTPTPTHRVERNKRMAPTTTTRHTAGLLAYVRLLARQPAFRTLWLGELLNSAGGWFAYVATLRRVAEL